MRITKSTILSIIAAAGVIATGYSTYKATVKAKPVMDNLPEDSTVIDKVEVLAPYYIRPALIGVSTIVCIFSANRCIPKSGQNSLAASYALLDQTFTKYRQQVVNEYGEEVDRRFLANAVRQNSWHQRKIDYPDVKMVWVDDITGASIEAYEREIMDAEYHLNRNFMLGGAMSLNQYLEFFGFPTTKDGEDRGWSMSEGYAWIDFDHEMLPNQDDNGTPICMIHTVFSPIDDYLEDWRYGYNGI